MNQDIYSDRLSAEAIRRRVTVESITREHRRQTPREHAPGRQTPRERAPGITSDIFVHDTIDSTNNEAKRLAAAGAPHGTAVLAEEQTSGRGRFGRAFYSGSGTGLYMSVILLPEVGVGDGAALITIAAAVAVCRAVRRFSGEIPEIKWVNDVRIGGKKICGILSEAVTDVAGTGNGKLCYVVVGIGLNVSARQEDFPPELRCIARSVYQRADDARVPRNDFAGAILYELLSLTRADSIRGRAFMDEYRELSCVPGNVISYVKDGTERTAMAKGIDDDGRLLVTDLTTRAKNILDSGEISIRISDI